MKDEIKKIVVIAVWYFMFKEKLPNTSHNLRKRRKLSFL